MNIGQAKQIDLVDYLASLGYNPSKIKREEYWYLSPLREERTASFKVDRRLNLWYDHGLGKGGNMVDFGTLYHNCPLKDLLKRLHPNLSFHQPPVQALAPEESLIKIISERNLVSLSLLRYIKQRRVAEEVAKKYCREIIFSLHDKTYLAIGFKNNEGGFELRNQWFKGSSSPKAITSFENGLRELSVFEGFLNFLSHQTIQQNQVIPAPNFLVLNSTSFFEKSKALMEQHDGIHLFLDRDKTGQHCTAAALSWGKKYRDESHLYKGYNDLNEWMQQIGKSQKKGLRQL